MSETFLIKNTRFDSSGSLEDKALKSFIIGPGELNGPGGQAKSSELRLYGLGSLKWGEGVNQNLLRLLENNACPAKEPGDYNPASDLFDYNPLTMPILPKDERDLGVGNGITAPIVGQSWFNTDVELRYTFTGAKWKTIVNDDGSLTLSGLLDMGGFQIINVKDAINPTEAMNQQTSDARYVNITGDVMDNSVNITFSAGGEVLGLPTIPSATAATSKEYVDATFVDIAGDTMTGSLTISGPTSDLNVDGSTVLSGDLNVLGTTVQFNSTPTVGPDKIMHLGNGGAGSGFDADMLDGTHLNDIALTAYPVGAIYMSTLNVDPTTLFGGLWAAYAQGLTLIGVGAGFLNGNSGGSADAIVVSHSHSAQQLPPHSHTTRVIDPDSANLSGNISIDNRYRTVNQSSTADTAGTPVINSSGTSGLNANLPPYIVTYMWTRTA